MTDYAKKIVEIQRIIQQSFLMVEEYCNPKTLLSRKRAGISLEFQLERTIDGLAGEIAEVKKTKIPDDEQAAVFLNEVVLLEKSSERLNGILCLLNVTKSLRNMKGEEASLLIANAEQEFNDLRSRHPFDKNDIEARSAHIVHCLFLAIVTDIQPMIDEDSKPLKRVPEFATRIEKRCFETEAIVRKSIDSPILSLRIAGDIEQHVLFSTEKHMEELQSDNAARKWMSTLKLERCKISKRANEVLGCLIELISIATQNPANQGSIARSISSIIQLFTIRAQPQHHSGVDAAIFFNDCHFIVIGMERAKFEHIYLSPNPTDAFNFGSLLNTMRKTARTVLIRHTVYVKTTYLTWPETALDVYMKNAGNDFSAVSSQLKRFAKLWSDVCSKNTYAYIMFMSCDHVLSLLIDTLLKLPDFQRATCSKVLPLVKEIVQLCSGYIQECESILKKKFVDSKMGKDLVKKVTGLKLEMVTRGADRSLAELFDFKLDS